MQNFSILGRQIGPTYPTYVIVELSCNHNGRLDEALRIIDAAHEAGADAIKLQTYTPDTIARDFKTEHFKIQGTMWSDSYTYDLYKKAQTPWGWHEVLKDRASKLGLHWFSSPFDESAVDFLEALQAPVYKVASFELVDLPLIRKMARTGKPIIMSTGMATLSELDEAVRTLKEAGCTQLCILHCNSGYPTRFEESNLNTIPVLRSLYDVPVGLSDHSMWADPEEGDRKRPMPHINPAEAVRLGACVVEVHLMLNRKESEELMKKGEGGFDWPFSREPEELTKMIAAIRRAEKEPSFTWETEEEKRCAAAALGTVRVGPTPKELASRALRPSLWITKPVKKGEELRFEGGGANRDGNFDSIRPGKGLHTRYAEVVEGARAVRDLEAGQPLTWDSVMAISRGAGGASGT